MMMLCPPVLQDKSSKSYKHLIYNIKCFCLCGFLLSIPIALRDCIIYVYNA
jgi:hypothetical protein